MIDVAAHAGVSLGTVSHALNHPERVRPQTLERVRRAIAELGFVRNANASSLAGRRDRTVGLVVIDIGNSLFVDIARGAQHGAGEHAMNLVIANSDNDDALQAAHLDFFNQARSSGILLAPSSDPRGSLSALTRRGVPVVVINYDNGREDHCRVLVDNEQVGYLAARHMIDTGRRRLAFVGGRDELQPVRERRAGVRRAVAEAGRRVRLVEIGTDDLNAPGGLHAGEQIASTARRNRPDGVIAVTDLLGMAIIQALGRRHLTVPGDVAVMGCDYNSRAWGGTISLTSVRMMGEQMGRAAIDLLAQEVSDPTTHHHERIVLNPSVVVRESTVGFQAREAAYAEEATS